MAVADVGAGTGLFTRMFAEEVGAEGKVYAVDIAPKFLDHIPTGREPDAQQHHGPVHRDLVELPPNSVDLVFVCDTYHHFEFPQRTLASIHRASNRAGNSS